MQKTDGSSWVNTLGFFEQLLFHRVTIFHNLVQKNNPEYGTQSNILYVFKFNCKNAHTFNCMHLFNLLKCKKRPANKASLFI